MMKQAKYNESTTFVAIRERQTEEGIDTLSVVVGIFDAESMIGEASAVLRDRLTLAPVVAAACDKRGEQAKVARSLIAAEKANGHNVTREAAAQSVSRMVKVGRVLAAHPTMDPLEAYSLTNRATGEQVEKAIGEKDAEKAAAALARKPKAAAGSGKPAKEKTPDSVREATHNTLAAAIEFILTTATEDQARAFYNVIASDLKPLAAALTGGAHTWADVVAATADAAADADEEQEEEAV